MGESADDGTDKSVREDAAAFQQLLESYRPRLKRCVSLRMDRRLSARFDASDVAQEAITQAWLHREEFLGENNRLFYSWLREIAFNRLMDLNRCHLGAQRRTVSREQPFSFPWASDASHDELAQLLADSASRPGKFLEHQEALTQVRTALAALRPAEREILVMRHLEQMSIEEIADVLKISHTNVSTRHLRALQKLQLAMSSPTIR